ncbi:hypothetical protein SAZ_01400 [Streptomyces noursei ZPM]|nr:hypothetical protein SAZ_01400 [Streptomyces noursei ZPM]EPY93465.1 hypothetical protein K530_48045 [Streptomyces noursei CCRC 11814]EXU91396.1 hypothetical protein P354_05985 [Streptomyces noursei PD-1]
MAPTGAASCSTSARTCQRARLWPVGRAMPLPIASTTLALNSRQVGACIEDARTASHTGATRYVDAHVSQLQARPRP